MLISRWSGYDSGKRWLLKHCLDRLSSTATGGSQNTVLSGFYFEIRLSSPMDFKAVSYGFPFLVIRLPTFWASPPATVAFTSSFDVAGWLYVGPLPALSLFFYCCLLFLLFGFLLTLRSPIGFIEFRSFDWKVSTFPFG